MKPDVPRVVSSPKVSITSLPYKNRHGMEKKLMALISFGAPGLLAAYLESHQKNCKSVIEFSDIPLPQVKYDGSTIIALAHRTALYSGVSQQTAQAITDSFAQDLETTTTPAQLQEITRDALVRFSEAVQGVNLESYSSSVRRCCEYIYDNLHSALSLDTLGNVCHLSPHYVSDLFRKEMGIGALQYVHQVKMQYAKFLLEHTDQGIAEIASLLSYPSHSNFTQRFKKVYGITPLEFRLICGKE